jgi:hypothetical protein
MDFRKKFTMSTFLNRVSTSRIDFAKLDNTLQLSINKEVGKCLKKDIFFAISPDSTFYGGSI